MSRRRGGLLVMLAMVPALVLLGGCDRDRASPGVVEAVVEGPAAPYGAAVLEVSGQGVEGVVEVAGTRIWSREVEQERIRFVVIQPGEGPLVFGVRLADRDGPAPTFTIVELADSDDGNVVPTGQERIRLRR